MPHSSVLPYSTAPTLIPVGYHGKKVKLVVFAPYMLGKT